MSDCFWYDNANTGMKCISTHLKKKDFSISLYLCYAMVCKGIVLKMYQMHFSQRNSLFLKNVCYHQTHLIHIITWACTYQIRWKDHAEILHADMQHHLYKAKKHNSLVFCYQQEKNRVSSQVVKLFIFKNKQGNNLDFNSA